MARRSGTLGIHNLPEDIIADVLGEEAGEQGSVADVDVSVDISDGVDAASSLPLSGREVTHYDIMTTSGMLQLIELELPSGERIWDFRIWGTRIPASVAEQIIIENNLQHIVPEGAKEYFPKIEG